MKFIPIIFLSLTMLCLCSCSGNGIQYISDIEDTAQTVDLSAELAEPHLKTMAEMSESIEIVSLETSGESIISYPMKCLVSSDYIYVMDNFHGGGVLIFTRGGKFVKRILHGQGPQEIGSAINIALDEQGEYLYILDSQNFKTLRLTKSGVYLGTYYFNSLASDLAVDSGVLLYLQPSIKNPDHLSAIMTADTATGQVKAYNIGPEIFPRVWVDNFQRYQGGFNFMKSMEPAIYHYCNGQVSKRFNFFVADYSGIDYSQYKDSRDLLIRYPGQLWIFSGDYYETSSLQIVQCISSSDARLMLRSKKTGNIATRKLQECSLDYFCSLRGIAGSQDNTLIGMLNIEHFCGEMIPGLRWDGQDMNGLISPGDMEKLRAVTPDDNPIIVLFKLKSEI